jgi:hypothetical protein
VGLCSLLHLNKYIDPNPKERGTAIGLPVNSTRILHSKIIHCYLIEVVGVFSACFLYRMGSHLLSESQNAVC